MAKQELNLMKKDEQVDFIANELGTTKKDAEIIYNLIPKLIVEGITNYDGILFMNICKIFKKERGERKGRNPKTGDAMITPAKTVVAVKLSKGIQSHVQ